MKMWALQKGVQSKTGERAFDVLRCDRLLKLRIFHLHWIGLQPDTRTAPRRGASIRRAFRMRA
jgi:hypothetical protein